jgi:hypothetical protein
MNRATLIARIVKVHRATLQAAATYRESDGWFADPLWEACMRSAARYREMIPTLPRTPGGN